MPSAAPTTIAVVLPPQEGFGPRRTGGIGLTVRHHALATLRHRTVVFGGPQDGPVFLDVTFRLILTPFIPGLLRLCYMFGLVRKMRSLRPVLIEVHAEPAIAARLQRLFPAIPVVLVLHDDPAGNRLTQTPQRRALLLERLAGLITVSAWLRDRYLDGIERPARMPVVVPPCVDLDKVPAPGNVLDARGIPVAKRRTRLVLFVGRLIAEKGADRFVSACTAALASLPGWRAEVIGASEPVANSKETPFARLLRARAEPAGIAMMGYRDHPDVMAAMARSAIVVIPSVVAEPGGRTALEAMANGAAVVCCPGGALAEIGGDAVVFADPGELAATIRVLGADPQRIAALSALGRQRAARYDLPQIGRLVDEWRDRIIGGATRQL